MQIGSILCGSVELIQDTLLRQFEITYETGDRMDVARMLVRTYPDREAAIGTAVIGQSQIGGAIALGQTLQITKAGASMLPGEPLFGEPTFGEASDSGVVIFAGTIVRAEPRTMVARRNVASSSEGGSTGEFGEPLFGGPLFGEGVLTERVNLVLVEARGWSDLLDLGQVEAASYTNTTDRDIIVAAVAAAAPEIDTANVATTATIATFQIQNLSVRAILLKLQELTGAEFYVDAEKQLHYFLPETRPAPYGFSEDYDGDTWRPMDRESLTIGFDWRTPANEVTVVGAVTTGGANITATEKDLRSQATYRKFARRIVDRQITSEAQARARALVELAKDAWPAVGGTLRARNVDELVVGQYVPVYLAQTVHVSGSYTIRRMRLTWKTKGITEYEIEWGAPQSKDLARAIRRLQDLSETPAAPPVSIPAPGTVVPGSLASTLEMIEPVAALPALPNSAYDANSLILLTSVSPRRVYRMNAAGTGWQFLTDTSELTGTITETQIANNSISTPKLQASSVDATKIAALSIAAIHMQADSVVAGTIATAAIRAIDAVFEAGAILNADIGDAEISSAKIGTAEIESANIANLSVTNIHIANNTITQTNMGNNSVGTNQYINASITSAKIISLEADKITSGTIAVGTGGITIQGSVQPLVIQNGSNSISFPIDTFGGGFSVHGTQALWVASVGSNSSGLVCTTSSSVLELIFGAHVVQLRATATGCELIFDGVVKVS